MPLHFCIREVLDILSKASALSSETETLLAPVYTQPPGSSRSPDDIFLIEDISGILDFGSDRAPNLLAELLKETPLYRYNLELAMDDALDAAARKPVLQKALGMAFFGKKMPEALIRAHANSAIGGSLVHPALGHFSDDELAEIYVSFIETAGADVPSAYGFEDGVLRRHAGGFLKKFNGFLAAEAGAASVFFLLSGGRRIGQNHSLSRENCVADGEATARSMNITDPHEILWAWREADAYLMRLCEDIDLFFNLVKPKKTPAWIKTDAFFILQREAMKQYFASCLYKAGMQSLIPPKAALLHRAIELNAQQQTDDTLQQIIAQLLGQTSSYAGSAGKFAALAKARSQEARAAEI